MARALFALAIIHALTFTSTAHAEIITLACDGEVTGKNTAYPGITSIQSGPFSERWLDTIDIDFTSKKVYLRSRWGNNPGSAEISDQEIKFRYEYHFQEKGQVNRFVGSVNRLTGSLEMVTYTYGMFSEGPSRINARCRPATQKF